MKTVEIDDAMARLSDLVDEVANGDSFLITKDGQPVALSQILKKRCPWPFQ